jgi:protein phosphatase
MDTIGTKPAAPPRVRKPRDDEIDVFGITHPGKKRPRNEDHFLICSLRKRLDVHLTSIPYADDMLTDTDRLAFLAMVADGVGGSLAGDEASRAALEAIGQYVTHSTHCYYTADATDDASFTRTLELAALRAHELVSAQAEADPDRRGMATTLTLWLGVWPRVYLLQVGDSRYYRLRHGALEQVSRDQTVAQDLLDQGAISRAAAAGSRWAHVLSSAIGGPTTTPVVTGIDNDWGDIHLLCSDGLTRHVSDERIRERLSTMTSARQVCEDLLEEALEGGGSDNITLIVGRALRRD